MRRIILGGLGILGLLLGPIAVPAHADTIKLKPTITISADPGVLDPEHPTATVSGQVKVADNGTDQPVAGLTVNLGTNSGWGSIASAVTDDTGHFTSTLIPTTEDSNLLDVFANTPETDTYIAAYADTLEVKLNRAPTRVALTASRTQSDEGQPVGVTGGVEWQSATGWKPAVGVAVTVWASASGCWPNGTPIVKTDSTGHFAAQLTLPCTATIYARAHGPVYQTTDGSVGPITVRQLVHFQSGASIDTNGNVWVGGSVNIDYQTGSFAGKPLNIQYSTGDGTWRTIKRIKFTDNGYGVGFWYGRSGYWRAVFPGDGGYVGATSPASKAWRWNTRFEKFKVSPHKVRKNRTVAVSGTLTRALDMKHRAGYANRKLEIIFRFKGKKTWYHLAWTKTNAKGRFSKKVKAYGSGYYAVIFRGSGDTFATWTAGKDYVGTYRAQLDGPAAPITPSGLIPPSVVPAEPAVQ